MSETKGKEWWLDESAIALAFEHRQGLSKHISGAQKNPLLKEKTHSAVEPTAAHVASGDAEVVRLSYSEELQQKLKRQKVEQMEQEKPKVYMDLTLLPGTSVNCERLFSAAKFILSDTRKRTSPKLFEALLLLKVNKLYWNSISVSKGMRSSAGVYDKDNLSDEDWLDIECDCES